MDVAGALAGLLLLLLPMAVLALVVLVTVGRPIVFRQLRAGQHGNLFWLYKFRTMNDIRDSEGQLLPDERRITRLGRLLRASSLDELPGLWNVLMGHMSLVGPRPLLPEYLPRYSAEQARRHEVKPGITGLAQVSGRNALGWEEKFELDTWYVDNRSISLDIHIMARTARKVIQREGINQQGQVTVEPFHGC
jgi:lipopolysaccharide/colanic/teichoic acid biosynthesis glycosyltransferase